MSRGVSETMDILAGLKVEVGFLSMAVDENDPHSELRVRVADIRETISRLTAALAAEPGAAEMVLVPQHPTAEMMRAGSYQVSGLTHAGADCVYRAMIAAAPHQSGESGNNG